MNAEIGLRLWKRWFQVRWREILVATVASFVLFFNVAAPPVAMTDEARLALNALEMMSSSNPVVVTYAGDPDLWSPKPPLAVWLSALSMELLGVNEFALRFPHVLAAVVTVVAVFAFARRASNSSGAGAVAAAALLGTTGYVETHVARTADYDSLLVLFLTLTSFQLFRATELASADASRAAKHMRLSAGFMACALFTKSFAALLIVPGYALYLLVRPDMRSLLARRESWLAAAAVLAVTTLFLSARELAHPGYLEALWDVDISGRFSSVSDGHGGTWTYYLSGLFEPWLGVLTRPLPVWVIMVSAFPWSWAALLLLPAALFARRREAARASLFLLCCLAGFLVAISTAATKLDWYAAPAYPLLATLSGIGASALADRLRQSPTRTLRGAGRLTIPAAIAAGLMLVVCIMWKTERQFASANYYPDQRRPLFLRQVSPQIPASARVRVLSTEPWTVPKRVDGRETYVLYDGATEFYVRLLKRRGVDAKLVFPGYELQPGEWLVGCGPMQTFVASRELMTQGDCKILAR